MDPASVWVLTFSPTPLGIISPTQVVSLSLAHNHLTSVLPLSPYLLTTSLSKIENVSFASNSLGKLRDMDPFSPAIGKPRGDGRTKGWPNLRELVLTGNPLVETGAREDHYRR